MFLQELEMACVFAIKISIYIAYLENVVETLSNSIKYNSSTMYKI